MVVQSNKSERSYGYMESYSDETVGMPKGHYVSGYSVGILALDECSYPTIPGNVVNLSTYDFPVVVKIVEGCTQERIHNGDQTLKDDIIRTAKQLEKEGAKAICAGCGFFGNFQDTVAEAVDIPVFLSSIVQIPWIQTGLKRSQDIGVLTADISGLNDVLFNSCRVIERERVHIRDLGRLPEFSSIVESRGTFNNAKMREEVIGSAVALVEENPNIGAILLECSDLPPYASDIQRAVGLPVFDFITMIKWIHFATSQKPYHGFI